MSRDPSGLSRRSPLFLLSEEWLARINARPTPTPNEAAADLAHAISTGALVCFNRLPANQRSNFLNQAMNEGRSLWPNPYDCSATLALMLPTPPRGAFPVEAGQGSVDELVLYVIRRCLAGLEANELAELVSKVKARLGLPLDSRSGRAPNRGFRRPKRQ